jgi:hypothetical protein
MFPSKRLWVAVLSSSVLLAAGTAVAGLAADGPHVGPNVQVNAPQELFPAGLQTRSTATLGASEDGQRLLAGWEDFRGQCGPPGNQACPPEDPSGLSGFGFSVDGGITWTDLGAVPPVGTAQDAGHPWIDRGIFGGQGDHGGQPRETFFLTSRLRDSTTGVFLGLSVHRGHFAAGNFTLDDAQAIDPPAATATLSRPAIAASKDSSGDAYIVETNLIGTCDIPFLGLGQIEVYRTNDGGDTWQGPAVVSPDASEVTDPNDPNCVLLEGPEQVSSAVAIGPKGEVYVVWQYGPNLQIDRPTAYLSAIDFSRSLDHGKKFSAPQRLADINANRNNQPVGYARTRMNDQPRIAVALSGRHQGRIYVTFYQPVQTVSTPNTVQSLVSTQSFLMYSDDHGQTWSAPKTLGPPVPPTGVKRFWPTVSVRPNGDVDVVYLESREVQLNPDPTVIECNVPIGGGPRRMGPAVSLVDTYLIQSGDGGQTFGAPIRISSQTSNWCTANYRLPGSLSLSNFGDYIGSASAGNRTLALWPDDRNGVIDIFFGDVQDRGGHNP